MVYYAGGRYEESVWLFDTLLGFAVDRGLEKKPCFKYTLDSSGEEVAVQIVLDFMLRCVTAGA